MSSKQGPRAAGMRTSAIAFSRRHLGGKECMVFAEAAV
jgi:hypothetical protein